MPDVDGMMPNANRGRIKRVDRSPLSFKQGAIALPGLERTVQKNRYAQGRKTTHS